MSVGKNIKNLRINNKLTQEELANLVNVSREAVSKWERDISVPNIDILNSLSKIFKVKLEQLISEEYIEGLYTINRKLKKKLIIFILMALLIITILLGLFFITNYKNTKIYTIDYSDENISITNGLFIITNEKLYFRLGDITSAKDIKFLKLYYYDNNKEKLIVKQDSLNIMLYDFNGYNNYFDYNKLDLIIDTLTLDVVYEDYTYTINLKLEKDYTNNKLFIKKIPPITTKETEDKLNKEYKEKINIIKDKFNYNVEDDNYYYTIKSKNKKTDYILIDTILWIIEKENNIERIWYVYFDFDMDYTYLEYRNEKIINNFSYSNNIVTCNTKTCKNTEKAIKYTDTLLNKVLK